MLILGSSSPRRREILSYFGIPFTVGTPPFDERAFVHNGAPEELVKELSEQKSHSLKSEFPDEPILCADTVVVFEGKVLNKPVDESEAHQMLKSLCGNTHQVISGVSVRLGDQIFTDVETADVTLVNLTDSQIETFQRAIGSLDKAGGYAIQGRGSLIVESIVGNFDCVMGLPMQTVYKLLKKVGIDLWDYLSSGSY